MADTFDVAETFDDDYLYFYADRVADERSDEEAGVIWELLDLEAGVRLLDLACGHGRLANRLARRGVVVTGVDLTQHFIELAEREAAEMGVQVSYVLGDMRDLGWHEAFDSVVSWFTSFGYFDDDENRRVLEGVYEALAPGGRFLVDIPHRDVVVASVGGGASFVVERDGDLMVDRNRFDPLSGRMLSRRTAVRDGRVRRFSYFVRMLSFTEIRDWLLGVGFREVEGLGEDGEPLSPTSRRMRVLARK